MFDHHVQTIQNAKEHFQRDPSVLALLLSGSIAHGFANASSDVDCLIVLSEDDFAQKHQQTKKLTLVINDPAIVDYPGGYVDCKYISLAFIRDVALRGSEPARFAFEGAQVLFTADDKFASELADALKGAVAYPMEGKEMRLQQFRAQLDAWAWYCAEARKRGDEYLLGLSARKLVLFGGRLILTHNEVLYPYHKWFMRVLDGDLVKEKPEGMLESARRLMKEPEKEENVNGFFELVKNFREWPENKTGWGAQFLVDSELTWMQGTQSVDDL